ncbi:hypothetical protein TIFTF001_015427 [Ficus carica]|uniref:EamA domain-containing protein n=1 Tax=Ficus carica TaxID=3494 RepID=A0AA88A5L9_FICCA|nr:hypothetical protein TIFTF001_015427 [Ficus carica]
MQSRSFSKKNGSNNVEWKRAVGREKKPIWRKVLFASKKFRSIVLLNVITIVYASDIMVIKWAEAAMNPAAFSAVRFIMSAIPFLPFVFRARDDFRTRNAGIELGFWLSLAYFVEAIGLLTSEAGRASFISLIGDLLNFLSAIFFGIHMLRTEHISRSTEKENFLALLGYETCVVALLSTMWVVLGGWFDGEQDFLQSTWNWTELWDWIVAFPWIPALYTGVFSTGICSFVEFAAMRDVSATETAIIYGLEPLWGAGFAWFLLGERWGALGWIGATFVLGGSLIVQMFGSSPTKKPKGADEGNQKSNLLLVQHEQLIKNGLSASPIVVRSTKDAVDILK